MSTTDPARLLEHINTAHGTNYRLVSRFESGEQGAYAIEDGDGTRAVLKWIPSPMAVKRYDQIREVTDRLANTGYPVPRYLYIGTDGTLSYSIQSVVPGELVDTLSPAHVARLIDLNRTQMAQAQTENPNWQRDIVHSVLHGWEHYCVIQSLRDYSSESAALLEELQTIVARWDGMPFRTNDIVHFDFHQRNVLTSGDEITGVIDWDGVSVGDCTFDLVTLLFYSYKNPAAREPLWNEITQRASRETVESYFAHMIVRQVDWTIRFYQPSMVEHFLALARRILDDIRPRYSSCACWE